MKDINDILGFLQALEANKKYQAAIDANDSKAALDARNEVIDAVNYTSKSQKNFDKITAETDSNYQKKFGAEAGTVAYNTQKGEADVDKSKREAPSESNGGGTFLTAGAGMDGKTMLTKGYLKKRQLGAS